MNTIAIICNLHQLLLYIKTSNTLLKIKIIINVDKYTHNAWHGYHRIFFLDSDVLQLLWFTEKAKIDHYYISIRKSCCLVYIIKKYCVQNLQILIIIYVKTYKSCLFLLSSRSKADFLTTETYWKYNNVAINGYFLYLWK